MRLNISAVVFWVLAGLVGYLISEWHGALIALAAALCVSLISTAIDG